MPLPGGIDPKAGVMADTTQKCPPEALNGPPVIRSGRVVDADYAAAASAELAGMERDLSVVGGALLYAAWALPEVRVLIDDPKRRSDIFAVSPAFLALSACGRGRWSLEEGANFCRAQVPLLEHASLIMSDKGDPELGSRIVGFASAAKVVERDLRAGGGYAMQSWKEFEPRLT